MTHVDVGVTSTMREGQSGSDGRGRDDCVVRDRRPRHWYARRGGVLPENSSTPHDVVPSLLLTNVAPNAWPTREQELLVAAALLSPQRAAEAWAEWKTCVDLGAVDLGTVRLLPLVYQNLPATVGDDALMDMSRGLYRRTWYMNHLLLRDAVPALAALRDAG